MHGVSTAASPVVSHQRYRPILQMGTLRHTEMKQLAQGSLDSKGQSQGWNLEVWLQGPSSSSLCWAAWLLAVSNLLPDSPINPGSDPDQVLFRCCLVGPGKPPNL